MRIWWLVGLAACGVVAGKEDTGADCGGAIDEWCGDATCEAVSVDSLLASSDYTWHGQCVDKDHGTLDFVNEYTGYGGPTWYFDSKGALVAFTESTDTPAFCGDSFSTSYGFDPHCESSCVVAPADADSGSPTTYAPADLPPC